MIYNDNPILPSDVLNALQNAYNKQANDTQQKTDELLGSFFVHSQKVCMGVMCQKSLPDDLTLVLAKIKTDTMKTNENLAELFCNSPKNTNLEMRCPNVFGILKNLNECVAILSRLAKNTPSKSSALTNYILNLNADMTECLQILEKKDIAIRRYL